MLHFEKEESYICYTYADQTVKTDKGVDYRYPDRMIFEDVTYDCREKVFTGRVYMDIDDTINGAHSWKYKFCFNPTDFCIMGEIVDLNLEGKETGKVTEIKPEVYKWVFSDILM